MDAEFPSNSNRDKEAKVEKPPTNPRARRAAETVTPKQVTEGKVIRRKKPLTKRLKELFISGDSKSVWGFVAGSVLIPAAKDMIADASTQAVERMVFGESTRGPRNRWGGGGPGHVRYDGFASSSPSSGVWGRGRPEPRREISARSRATHDFGEIILESRGEAEQVVDQMYEVLSQYTSVSVSDLYAMVGITPAYTDQKYGWTDLQGTRVDHVRGGGYLINLQRPEQLDS